jgi:hypothetical protein
VIAKWRTQTPDEWLRDITEQLSRRHKSTRLVIVDEPKDHEPPPPSKSTRDFATAATAHLRIDEDRPL